MTNEDAIDYLKCSLDGGCTQMCSSKYRGECSDEQVLEALDIAIEALEKADKYRWHDLREDPTDLPKVGDLIYITNGWNEAYCGVVVSRVGGLYLRMTVFSTIAPYVVETIISDKEFSRWKEI